MAKMTVTGACCTLTSSVKVEDLRKVLRFRPEVGTLKDKEGNPYFLVAIETDPEGIGNIGEFGIEFAPVANPEGFAFANFLLPNDVVCDPDMKTLIAEQFGGVIDNLVQIEEKVPVALAEINAKIQALAEKITVA